MRAINSAALLGVFLAGGSCGDFSGEGDGSFSEEGSSPGEGDGDFSEEGASCKARGGTFAEASFWRKELPPLAGAVFVSPRSWMIGPGVSTVRTGGRHAAANSPGESGGGG